MPSSDKDRELLRKLEALLDEARAAARPLEFDLNSLFDRLRPGTLADLALALRTLVSEGKVSVVFRVVSPAGGGLGDFRALTDIPDTVEDRYNDWQELQVTPDRVIPVYTFQ